MGLLRDYEPSDAIRMQLFEALTLHSGGDNEAGVGAGCLRFVSSLLVSASCCHRPCPALSTFRTLASGIGQETSPPILVTTSPRRYDMPIIAYMLGSKVIEVCMGDYPQSENFLKSRYKVLGETFVYY